MRRVVPRYDDTGEQAVEQVRASVGEFVQDQRWRPRAAVGEAGELDAKVSHDFDAAKLKAVLKLQDCPAVEQRDEGVGRAQRGASLSVACATQAGETRRPMMRSPSSVWSR